ncbi:fungal-specific transcription factor domain-containing protein [Thelonectria olida]|uniref:Fungal-specific transcription factor domain-containing protein n=1 Tax=Thelonectria olida TaxID=1576542 RepID=A0A9P9AH44_9HYPO|nr:fungal-specific transcription factor domain-containing protein [Thelonectria olida]
MEPGMQSPAAGFVGDSARPAKRKRVALACDNCRDRKVRCDGRKPVCGPCEKRGEAGLQCSYNVIADTAKRASEQEYIASLQRQVQELRQVVKDFEQHRAASSGDQRVPSVTEVGTSGAQEVGTSRPESSSRSPSQLVLCPNDGSAFDEPDRGQPLGVEAAVESTVAEGPRSFITDTRGQTQCVENHGPPQALDVGEEGNGPSPVSAMGATTSVQGRAATSRNDEFYGRSSVLSLLREVPHSTVHHGHGEMGTRQARTSPRRPDDRRRSVQAPSNAMLQTQYALPPREVADQLVHSYFSNVHIFYPWTHSIAFQGHYESLWARIEQRASTTDQKPDIGLGGRNCPRPVFFCALNAIFALGCEFSSFPSEEKEAASAVFYSRMKDLLHFQLLDHGSISHVQALLLAAHYLFCTQYPTHCYNIVGLACRMAIGLGLQSVGFSERHSKVETEIRRRVWYGCLQVEMTVSMTLGRPPSMHIVSDVPLPSAIDDEYLQLHGDSSQQPQGTSCTNLFMVENIKLAKILALILDRIYNPVSWEKTCCGAPRASLTSHHDFGTLTYLDSLLEDLRDGLPDALRWDHAARGPDGRSPLLKRQSNVIQARFLHLKILLFRPSFSDFCASTRLELSRQPPADSPNPDQGRPKESSLKSYLRTPCAVACVEAACQLVASVERATREDATGAWWFNLFYMVTCGVVLVLGESTDAGKCLFNQHEIGLAWKGCTETLMYMSKGHTRARDYLRLLQSLRQRTLADRAAARTTPRSCDPAPHDSHAERPGAVLQHSHAQDLSHPINRMTSTDERSYAGGGEVDAMSAFFNYENFLENPNINLENLMLPPDFFSEIGI